MGRRLPDEVEYRIRVRIEAGEGVPAIAKAIGVLTVPCTKYEPTLTSMRQLVLYKVDQVLLLLLHLILIFNIGLGSSRWGWRCRGY